METNMKIGDTVIIGQAYRCGHLGNRNNIKEGAHFVSDEWTGKVGQILTIEKDGDLGLAFNGHDEVEVWIHSGRVTKMSLTAQ